MGMPMLQTALFDEAKKQPLQHDPPPEEQSPGEFYRELYRKYCQTIDSHESALQQLCDYERSKSPCTAHTNALHAMGEYEVAKTKAELAKDIKNGLVHYASKIFAPEGATLTIDTQEIYETLPIDEKKPEKFDPAKVWEHLKSKYGNGEGTQEAWKQVANRIIHIFYIKKDSEVKRSGNYTRIDLRVYIDSFDKKFDKRNRLHYNCRQELHDLLAQLSSFALWCHKKQLAVDLQHLSHHYFGYSTDSIESHKQLTCGEKGEIVVVTFTTRFEFRFRNDVAEQLQMFLGTYGTFKE